MPGGPGDLYAAAEEFLAACSTALEGSPGGPIDYQVIWQGLPPYDCVPALFVHAGGTSAGDTYPLQPPLQPMQRIPTTGLVQLVQFTCTVLRCVPVIGQTQQSVLMPTPAEVNASTLESYGDLWAIWNYLKNAHREGILFQTPSGRREFLLDAAVPVRTSGGAGGWEIPIRVQLGGYKELNP